jgi:hypothetical protein
MITTSTTPQTTGSTGSNDDSNKASSFHKYKMQLMEKGERERILKEQEKLQKEKESSIIKSSAKPLNDDYSNRVSPQMPTSPFSVPQSTSDIDSNSQLSPPPPQQQQQGGGGGGVATSPAYSSYSTSSEKSSSSNKQQQQQQQPIGSATTSNDNNNPLTPPTADTSSPSSSSTTTTTAPVNTELKRVQSIQEMREKEKRRREEIAGKIDMNEQFKLMSQFEQNLK